MASNIQTPAPVAAGSAGEVTHIAIREFDQGSALPTRTVRIPVRVFSIAATLVPRRIREELAKEGFDLDGILAAAREIRSPVTLVEVEEHQKGRKIVIALE